MPIDNSASILTRRQCVFCLFNTVVFSCCFFLHFGRMPLFFLKKVAVLATKCSEKENSGPETVGSFGQKYDGDAHPCSRMQYVGST